MSWFVGTSRVYDGSPPPPPWPVSDPRTAACPHGWDRVWGEKGERQRKCRYCNRWVWEHNWPGYQSEERFNDEGCTPTGGAVVR